MPTTNIGVRPSRASSRGRDPRHREDAERQREERQAGGHRAEAELVLEVLHGQEEHRQLAADDQRDDGQAADAGDGCAAAPAGASGATTRRLGDGQHDEQRRRRARARRSCAAEAQPCSGAPISAHTIGDGAEGRGDARRRRRSGPGAGGLVEQPPGQGEHREADRDVDEQRPAPGAEVGDDAAEQQADRHAAGGDRAEEGERPVAGRLVGGAGGEQGEHAGRGERGTDALGGRGRRPATRGSGRARRPARRA